MAKKSRSKKRGGIGKFFMTVLIIAIIAGGLYMYIGKGDKDKLMQELSPVVEKTVDVTNDLVSPLFNKKDHPHAKGSPYTQPDSKHLRKDLKVKLFYYNGKKDKQTDVDSAQKAVLPVKRTIPASMSPIRDTIALLLEGKLTPAEKTAGFSTEFPHEHFKLIDAKLRDGILYLHFSDPDRFSTGGSSRVAVLSTQITRTALQFPGVKEVRFIPETLFQP